MALYWPLRGNWELIMARRTENMLSGPRRRRKLCCRVSRAQSTHHK